METTARVITPAPSPTVNGYRASGYARSLAFAGDPSMLEASGGWMLERDVPDSDLRDAMGCYPVLCCTDWSRLGDDLDAIGDELVSVTCVTDPFAQVSPEQLEAWFPDLCRPFKEHFVIDLAQDPNTFVCQRHRSNVRRGLSALEVEPIENPLEHLDTWMELYGTLIERHNIQGIAAFSRDSFEQQMQVPGSVMLRVHDGDETVGAGLYFLTGDVAHCHLVAYNDRGYEQRAAYALFWTAIEFFKGRADWLAIGANAGNRQKRDGLDRFKRGWATGTRTAYLCGRITDYVGYAELIERDPEVATEEFFPLYRSPR